MDAAQTLREALRASMRLTDLTIRLRLVTVLLVSLLMFFVQGIPALVLLSVTDESLVWRVAAATKAGPVVTGWVFVGLSLLLLPLLAVQFGGPHPRWQRLAACKLAVRSLCVTAVVWMLLAYRAIPLDYGLTHLLFALHGAGALAVAGALAWIINADQLRQRESA